jgi:copper homeostasis protein
MDVEICINADSPDQIRRDISAALAGGSSRVELCSQMALDGLSPTPEQITAARQAMGQQWGLMVMVRPRAGDFAYTKAELAQMLGEIAVAAQRGAVGVVLGLALGGEVAEATIVHLAEEAKRLGLSVTFHRAFDALSDPVAALPALISAGVDRVLTSGTPWGTPGGAEQGVDQIARYLKAAEGQLEFVLGGGVTPHNIAAILTRLPARPGELSVHAHGAVHRNGQVAPDLVAALVSQVKGEWRLGE